MAISNKLVPLCYKTRKSDDANLWLACTQPWLHETAQIASKTGSIHLFGGAGGV